MAASRQLVDDLVLAVRGGHVITDNDAMRPFATDWTARWVGEPLAVVRPRSTEEVAAAVKVCVKHKVAVVPQGGNTGLVAGAVPPMGSVLISLTQLNETPTIDLAARQATVGAGVTIAELQNVARTQGLDYGVDLGSRESATVGGTIATNAGGIRVVCNGDTRRQVLGVEAVTAEGEVLSQLGGLPKDSAGFDVSNLLVGSEGTLGIITRARLRLTMPLPQTRTTVLVGLPDVNTALNLVDRNRERGLLAAEFLTRSCMELVCAVAHLPHPVAQQWPFYLLLETDREPVLDATADAAFDRRLWTYRENQTDVVSTRGPVHKLDVAVPLKRLADCLEKLPEVVAPHDVYVFGHLAEGNLHIEVVGPEYADIATEVAVLQYVASLGGTISAEHGVGRAKAHLLHLSRDEATLKAMRSIKNALDPGGVFNPGALLPS